MLRINNLSKKFGNKAILDNISLSVPSGNIALLLGSSGVGKSTLLRILNNLESIDTGTVELNGKRLDLAKVNKTHTIGMVFQQFNLFEHMTVEENIVFPLEKALGLSKDQATQIAHDLLKKYGLLDKSHVYASRLS
ncbi:MAG TPA: ATP-binding cassette domain-containing protein, partial [Candidatus Babeliaceae bacterium]|nr:ATP-binding cassette domain-containing protein [Candidatus Babeliaceae bacterium]